MMTAELKGDKELVKIFDKLVDDYGPKEAKKVLRPAIKASLVDVADQIKRTTPVDTVALRNSTGIKVAVPSAKKRKRNKHRVLEGLAGWLITKGSKHPSWPQAAAVEYGTEKRPGLGVIKKAYARNAQKIEIVFAKEFRERLLKRVRQLRVQHGVKK